MKTIAIDFDGVIHKYSKGWQDGSIYDEPIEGAFMYIEDLIDRGYCIFILSTRSPRQIKKWMNYYLEHIISSDYYRPETTRKYKYTFTVDIVPFWKKFWDKRYIVGITQRKLPAIAYIDDRAVKFEGDFNTLKF